MCNSVRCRPGATEDISDRAIQITACDPKSLPQMTMLLSIFYSEVMYQQAFARKQAISNALPKQQDRLRGRASSSLTVP